MTGRALIAGLGQNAALVKLTPDGAIVREKIWGAGLDAALGVAVGDDGSIFMTGNTASGSGSGDLFLVNFAPTGKAKDAKTWGGSTGNESGQGVAVASDGAVYVAGVASAPPYVVSKASTATKSPKGTSLETPNGTVTDPGVAATRPRGVVTDVLGDHSTFGGETDAALLKIAP